MIVSASRRTDIPAFYSQWLMGRLREGFVCVRNPMNFHQVSKVSLAPEVVDCIVFWTKNPQNIMASLKEITEMGYSYYFQFTLTPYDLSLEHYLPPKSELVEVFKTLADLIGPQRVIWRYDPILLTDEISPAYHVKKFEALGRQLAGYTERCVISFVDLYGKTKRNTQGLNLRSLTEGEMYELGSALADLGDAYGITLSTCAEAVDLTEVGIRPGACIDSELIKKISGVPLRAKKDRNQRRECRCAASIDIGAYNTCGHGCLYCYANHNPTSGQKNLREHDPNSPFLASQPMTGDVVKMRW